MTVKPICEPLISLAFFLSGVIFAVEKGQLVPVVGKTHGVFPLCFQQVIKVPAVTLLRHMDVTAFFGKMPKTNR